MKKKSILFLALLLSIFLFPISANAINKKSNDQINSYIKQLKSEINSETNSLRKSLAKESNPEKQNELKNKIIFNLVFTNADIKLIDVNKASDSYRATLEVSHNLNLRSYLEYHNKLSKFKEATFQKEDSLPSDASISCFSDTLSICQRKKTSCTIDIDITNENGAIDYEISPLSYPGMIRSLLF